MGLLTFSVPNIISIFRYLYRSR